MFISVSVQSRLGGRARRAARCWVVFRVGSESYCQQERRAISTRASARIVGRREHPSMRKARRSAGPFRRSLSWAHPMLTSSPSVHTNTANAPARLPIAFARRACSTFVGHQSLRATGTAVPSRVASGRCERPFRAGVWPLSYRIGRI